MSPVPSIPWTERERAEFKRRISAVEAGGSGPTITVGTTPPASPAVGDLWVDTN